MDVAQLSSREELAHRINSVNRELASLDSSSTVLCSHMSEIGLAITDIDESTAALQYLFNQLINRSRFDILCKAAAEYQESAVARARLINLLGWYREVFIQAQRLAIERTMDSARYVDKLKQNPPEEILSKHPDTEATSRQQMREYNSPDRGRHW